MIRVSSQTVYFGNSEHMDAIPANSVNLLFRNPGKCQLFGMAAVK